MAVMQRITALKKRHEWLDQMLCQELKHCHPDEMRVIQIKKSKLRVKDEMLSLENIRRKLEGSFDDSTQLKRSVH